jgi:hypothetical protein
MMHPFFSVSPPRKREALVWLPRRAGSSEIPWRIHSLLKRLYIATALGNAARAHFNPQHLLLCHMGLY